ncbi:MAG TPA: hypothetical protein VFK05_19915 [Polyangiaceae bacterium]|nr:hypothetical protein [Polyangiaceae bacterium]
MSQDVELTVSLSNTAPAEVARVAAALRAAGLQITATLEQIAVITGRADESAVDAIARVPGVTHVERQGSVQIPPPDSPVQ